MPIKEITTFDVKVIGTIESPLKDIASAPRQADEGAASAWLVIHPQFADALLGLRPGDEIVLLTWLDRADRAVLRNHPRGDPSRPQQGVFSTRSPNRPNPIGLHDVRIAAIHGHRVQVESLEAVHGTPILDIKGKLHADISRR
jgi:tRNA-Thr(GGU) m(6)t(6)A37 methyltransferase TsaA